jgi:hypothetical protein
MIFRAKEKDSLMLLLGLDEKIMHLTIMFGFSLISAQS